MRAKSLFLIVACVCGMVAAVGASQIMQGQGVPAVAKTTDIFVASRAIEPSERITAGMMTLQSWPADRIPPGATNNLAMLEGKYAGQRFFAGEPMMLAKLADTASAVSVQIPDGFSVVSMRADAATSVAGLVRPGDRVNVLAYFSKSEQIPETGVKTVLRGVKVFAVDGQTSRLTESETHRSPSTVSLLIQREDEEAWALASELGKIRLSLSGPADDASHDQVSRAGSRFLQWIEEHQRVKQLAEMQPVTTVVDPVPSEPKVVSVVAPAVLPVEIPVAAPAAPEPPGFKMLKLHGGQWTEYEIPADKSPVVVTSSSKSDTVPSPLPVQIPSSSNRQLNGQNAPLPVPTQPAPAHDELTLRMD